MATLYRSSPYWEPTASMVWCSRRYSGSSLASPASETRATPVVSSIALRQSRCRKRNTPTMSSGRQARSRSRGPIAISYMRRVSAPYAS